jgi:thiamine monophosphate synthase
VVVLALSLGKRHVKTPFTECSQTVETRTLTAAAERTAEMVRSAMEATRWASAWVAIGGVVPRSGVVVPGVGVEGIVTMTMMTMAMMTMGTRPMS